MKAHKKTVAIIDAAAHWLRSKPNLSDATRTAYRGELVRLSEYLSCRGVVLLQELTSEHWEDYLHTQAADRSAVLSKKKAVLKVTSQSQAQRITRAFLFWALEEGWINWVPKSRTTTPKDSGNAPLSDPATALDGDLLHILTGRCACLDPMTARDYLVINLAFWGTLKPSDIAALRIAHFANRARSGKPRLVREGCAMQLPAHMIAYWQIYRDGRRHMAGTDLQLDAPLIARHDSETPLSPRDIWVVVRKWQGRYAKHLPHLTPRFLRQAYIELALHQAADLLWGLCAQTGIKAIHVKTSNTSARRSSSVEKPDRHAEIILHQLLQKQLGKEGSAITNN